MTATTGEKQPRRSTGFTIESLIGKDSDRTPEIPPSSPSTSFTTNTSDKNHRNITSDYKAQPNFRITSHKDVERRVEERFQIPSSKGNINDVSVCRDARDNINGFHRTHEPLKHIQDIYVAQNAASGTVSTSILPPRLCRHPLSTLNFSGVYPSHLPPSTSNVHPMLVNNTRDIRQLYPWFGDRYPGCFYPRYSVGGSPGFLFQPYRKPKRIRTAFSPSQLLQLEKAFEKSHYVVGQERKELASDLQLTETQVKVWFQNRRTKHKRMKAEEEATMTPKSHDYGGGVPNNIDFNDCLQRDTSHEESDISDIDDEMDDEQLEITQV
ncbi:hypothetical protein ScPMuIL_001689 [Solemya velum]